MKRIVTVDRLYNPIYEGDIVITQHGRVCKVVWRRTSAHIGYDLEPYGFLDYAPPDKDVMWSPYNLIKVFNFSDDYIQYLINEEVENAKRCN